jgi:hypothetical protein
VNHSCRKFKRKLRAVSSKLNHLLERNSCWPVEVLEGQPGEMGELERNRLAMEAELAPNVRLSCQIRVASDLKVRVINQASVRGMDPGPRPFDE